MFKKMSALQATVEVDKSKLILILKKYKKIIIIIFICSNKIIK